MAGALARIVRAPLAAAGGPSTARPRRGRTRDGTGPGPRARTARGGRCARAVLRAIAPYTVHQRLVDEELLRALQTLDERVRGLAAGPGRRWPPRWPGSCRRARGLRSLAPAMSASESSLASTVGVNVVGYLRGGLGLGQAARLYVAGAARAPACPVRTTTVDVNLPDVVGADGARAQVKTIDFADLHVEGELPFNLVCVNAPELPAALRRGSAREFFEDRYTIGVWAWEVDVVPPSWDRAFGARRRDLGLLALRAGDPLPRLAGARRARPAADRRAAAGRRRSPACTCPTASRSCSCSTSTRRCSARTRSASSRRSRARSRRARGRSSCSRATTATSSPSASRGCARRPATAPDIHIVDRFLDRPSMAALMRRADCYVSLHRAEGFGLTLGETMALGKPVIAHGLQREPRLHDRRELLPRAPRGDARRARGRELPRARHVGRARPRPRRAAHARGLGGPGRGAARAARGPARDRRALLAGGASGRSRASASSAWRPGTGAARAACRDAPTPSPAACRTPGSRRAS